MQERGLMRIVAALVAGLLLAVAGHARAAIPCDFTVLSEGGAVRLATSTVRAAAAPTGTLSLSPAYLPYAYNGEPYDQAITATGGTAPYVFTVTSGALPPGLVLAASGALSGIPSVDGAFSFTVTANDAVGATGSLAYTLEVGTFTTIVVSPASVPDATVDLPYSVQFTASGGTAPYTFECTGDLPNGLVVDAGGLLSGTPLEAGTFVFNITAIDATLEFSGQRTYTLGVQAASLVLTPPSLPNGTVGTPYTQDIDASGGGTPPYAFSVTGGALPAGLAMNVNGTIDGTPEVAGSFGFTVAAMDATNTVTGERNYSVDILAPTIALDPATLPDGTVGADYSQVITASGGTAPYTFAVSAGTLAPGLFLDSDGTLHGAPTEPGSFAFTVAATDGFNQVGEQAYSLVVAAPTIILSPASLPAGVVGTAYAQPIEASGGTAPYSFAVGGGSLPPGMSMDGDGIVDGTPEAPGEYAFDVIATDAFGQTGSRMYLLSIAEPAIVVEPASLPGATVGFDYAQAITATGGTAPYTFAVTSGALVPGLFLDSDGTLHGAPTEAGSFGFTVTATDNFNQVGSRAYTVLVEGATIIISPATLPPGVVGTAYEQVLEATGGIAPYTYSIATGSLPPGMAMDGDGIIDGTPEAPGTFAFEVCARDAFGQCGSQSYQLTIAAPSIDIAPASLPGGIVGVDYAQVLSASGGTAPYTFAVTSGTLAPGLFLDSDGTLHGAPTDAGSFDFTVTATDRFDQAGERGYTLAVSAPDIVVAPATLPGASVDAPYSVAFTATGGTAPYSFAIGEGALPPGLVLGSDGTLAGTPTADGDFLFTVEATDAFEQAGSADYTLSVAAPALPDPTVDPEVIGLLTSQVNTVRTFVTTQVLNVHERMETLHDGSEPGWGFWVAGSFRTGDRDGSDIVAPLDFETSGVTGGSDYRLNDSFAFGGALGFARDRTAIGDDGSRSDGDAPSGVSYMSWHPDDMPFFLDGMGGVQRLEFDVRRFSAAGAAVLEGRRRGKQEFTSWSGGYEYRTDTFLFSPYARVDAAEARLDAFAELGDNPYALQYGPQDIDLRTTTLGFRMKFNTTVAWGELEPRLRVEYQRDFHDESGVAIRYANQASSPVFFTTPTGLDRNRVIVELGTLLRTNWYGLLFRVDYLGVFGGVNDDEHMLRFSMQED